MLIYTCRCCGRQLKLFQCLPGIVEKRDRICKRCEKSGRKPNKPKRRGAKNGKVNK